MKFSFLTILLLSISLLGRAQILESSSDSLLFPNTLVGNSSQLQISIQNTSSQNLQVNNIKFYQIYGDFPFSVDTLNFSLAPNASINLTVSFTPEHNIFHNSEMVIFHNGNGGMKSIDLRGQGEFSNPYYNVTQNLEEQALKNALKTRTGVNYNSLGYNAARDVMFMTIDNKRLNGQNASTNTLECVYTGFNKTGYTSRSDAQSTSPNFNTEHTFPQSLFDRRPVERSDLHHLYPTTNASNSQRANKPFGNVSNGTPVTLGGGSFYNSSTFEPRNAQKGKVARAMMYFVIRYKDSNNFFQLQENILKNWHSTYLPDSVEIRRNNDIFTVQGNRNPFVDYPQLAERISSFTTNSVAPAIRGIDITQTSINFGTVVNQLADTFEYVVVNRGNQPLTFSNFSLSSTQYLSFAGGFGGSIVIQPGDALIVPIVFNSNNMVTLNESVSFNTSLVGGQSNLTIPISGNSILVGLEESETPSFKMYPNPVEDVLILEQLPLGQKQVRIFDLKGNIVLETSANEVNFRLDVSGLAKGNYFLELNAKERVVFQKGR